MSRPVTLPARLAARLARTSSVERESAAAYERARVELARALAAAAAEGYSVRELAELVDRSRSATHRLVQDGSAA